MRWILFGLVIFGTSSSLVSAEEHLAYRKMSDLTYRTVGDIPLKLDLYLPPKDAKPVPCVVFVHGGGWKNGDKQSAGRYAFWLTTNGIAVASINYRLTDVAQWPAQIDDCYAAVRWIRKHADQYGIAPTRIGAWGTSAGGHLAALMGTRPEPKRSGAQSADTPSSRVDAVCDWFGPSDLLTMPPNTIGNGRTADDVAKSNGAKLLGASVGEVPDLAADASALEHVDQDDAAFLIMHGEKDPGVPLVQSQQLHAKLIRSGQSSHLVVVPDAGHGGKEFQTEWVRDHVVQFFQKTLPRDPRR